MRNLANIKDSIAQQHITDLATYDMQRGFVTPECQPIVPTVTRLIEHFYLQNDLVIFTKFHNTVGSPYSDYLGWRELQHQSSQALLPELETYVQRVFVKYGYSIWTEGVLRYVATHNIEQIYFAGLDTDACIYESALQAFDKHIQPIVVSDACMSSAGQAYHLSALQLLKRQIGEDNIISANEIVDASY